MYGYLSFLRGENDTLNAHYIAYIELLELLIFIDADVVAFNVYLYASLLVENVSETRLSHNAFREQSTGYTHVLSFKLAVSFDYIFRMMCLVVFDYLVRILPFAHKDLELISSLLDYGVDIFDFSLDCFLHFVYSFHAI